MRKSPVAVALAAIVTVAVVVALWWARSPEATFVKVGHKAPDLELPTLGSSGVKTRLSNFEGRPILLVMFMAGCHICEDEMWAIERMHREFLQRGLRVIGVAVDKDEASVADFVKRHDVTFIVLLDGDGKAVREAYHSWKMPEAYLIDGSGTVDAVYLGSVDWRSAPVRERVERLLPPAREKTRRP